MANEVPKQFFDVVRPGKSAANATSKPIIVGNRPIIKDPMFHTEPKPAHEEAQKPEIKPLSKSEENIEPKTELDSKSDFGDELPEKFAAFSEPDDSKPEPAEKPQLRATVPVATLAGDNIAPIVNSPNEMPGPSYNQQTQSTPEQSSVEPVGLTEPQTKAKHSHKLLIGLGAFLLVGVVAAVAYFASGIFVK